jgi:hypothetical protein
MFANSFLLAQGKGVYPMNKIIKVNFRTTEYEYSLLLSRAKKAGMSLSEYLRKAAFDKGIIIIDGLREHLYDFRKLGNNVNQIAAAANQGHDVAPTMAAIKARMFQHFDVVDDVLRTGGVLYSDCQTDSR